MYPEIMNFIWLIIGLTVGISVTGIFAVNETNKLRWVNDLLQSDLNRQIKINKTLKLHSVSPSDNYVEELERGIDELSALRERANKHADEISSEGK